MHLENIYFMPILTKILVTFLVTHFLLLIILLKDILVISYKSYLQEPLAQTYIDILKL